MLEGVEPLQDDDLPDNVVDFAAMEEDSAIPSSTLQSKKKKFQKEDRQFLQMYNKLQTKMWKFHDENNLDSFIQYLSDKQEILNECRDHFGRTLLHFSAEHDNLLFAQCILSAGFNPNVVEYCGATPLTLAVCLNLPRFCELLVKCGCEVRGPVFVGIPSPLEMARKLENAQIYEILNPDESDSEDADLRSYEKKFSNKDQANTCTEREHHKDHGICRSTAGFLTGIVGDAGTCKVNRSVMERSSAYSWIGIIPGDLHTKVAMIESCFKEQCAGGFHHLVKNVLKRPKLKTEVFKDKKFEEDNYRKIREAVRDCAKSYCMAAVQEFRVSNSFPDPGTLRSCFRKYGNHNRAIVDTFLNWININNEKKSFL